uniref:Uncharacterized protein n=1 Tax=Chromera velia CCMP2878 TaxID=1169474 RepID=A0A0G4I0A4_9ALVE|eukprot:Cvel_9884.t1-p1 / transcript=Cvel_9884.t1 / gene=Cvel_9884 / organism=Chromera_velia_CCMP2878 / gene_product=hypothetical protein / transcript_product=hypothetical protein / location=Cvel_scaffold583:27247-29444(+) / protein_length=390 / sequence_SO=supercontig / SO=protein_coding / is_pseudo=false
MPQPVNDDAPRAFARSHVVLSSLDSKCLEDDFLLVLEGFGGPFTRPLAVKAGPVEHVEIETARPHRLLVSKIKFHAIFCRDRVQESPHDLAETFQEKWNEWVAEVQACGSCLTGALARLCRERNITFALACVNAGDGSPHQDIYAREKRRQQEFSIFGRVAHKTADALFRSDEGPAPMRILYRQMMDVLRSTALSMPDAASRQPAIKDSGRPIEGIGGGRVQEYRQGGDFSIDQEIHDGLVAERPNGVDLVFRYNVTFNARSAADTQTKTCEFGPLLREKLGSRPLNQGGNRFVLDPQRMQTLVDGLYERGRAHRLWESADGGFLLGFEVGGAPVPTKAFFRRHGERKELRRELREGSGDGTCGGGREGGAEGCEASRTAAASGGAPRDM